MGAEGEPKAHSRAFEDFVDDGEGDDYIGLLAYALYKQNLRQKAKDGHPYPSAAARVISPSERSAYRSMAERHLMVFTANVVEQEVPKRVEGALKACIDQATVAINGHIDLRTRFGAAIITNLIAWVISLALTVLVYFSLVQPSLIEAVGQMANRPSQPASRPQ